MNQEVFTGTKNAILLSLNGGPGGSRAELGVFAKRE